jgi:hypothetical protein
MSAAVPGHRVWSADAADAREGTPPSPDGEFIASLSARDHGVRTTGARPPHAPDARPVPARPDGEAPSSVRDGDPHVGHPKPFVDAE